MKVTLKNNKSKRHQGWVDQKSERITSCPHCRDVHYKGIWYAPDSKLALFLDEDKDTIYSRTCPACQMQKEGRYESVLYVKDIPGSLIGDVVTTILNEAQRIHIENPQNRLLEFSEIIDGFRITTTSAAMVGRIGKKIKESFDSCEVYSNYKRDKESFPITKVMFVTTEYLK